MLAPSEGQWFRGAKEELEKCSYAPNTSSRTRTWVNAPPGLTLNAFVQFYCHDVSTLVGVIIFEGLFHCFASMFLFVKSGIFDQYDHSFIASLLYKRAGSIPHSSQHTLFLFLWPSYWSGFFCLFVCFGFSFCFLLKHFFSSQILFSSKSPIFFKTPFQIYVHRKPLMTKRNTQISLPYFIYLFFFYFFSLDVFRSHQ